MLAAIRKVLITDDHSLVRAGIAHLVSRLLPEAEVLHAETRLGTLQALAAHPDIGLLVVDLTLADAHGLGIIESVFAHHPLLPVVVVSGVEDADLARRAVALGVLGFVAKSADSAATEAALQTVLNGGHYLPSFAYAVPQQKPFSPSNLSERQTEVMRLMCEGLSNKQIGAALGLTEATVKGHLTLVFRALKVSSRSQAILAAQALPH
jgi:DNA-binding NarL/FixJ family response regulator